MLKKQVTDGYEMVYAKRYKSDDGEIIYISESYDINLKRAGLSLIKEIEENREPIKIDNKIYEPVGYRLDFKPNIRKTSWRVARAYKKSNDFDKAMYTLGLHTQDDERVFIYGYQYGKNISDKRMAFVYIVSSCVLTAMMILTLI